MGLFSLRPKARIKIGQHFMSDTTSLTAEGYVLYKEWDSEDSKFYYWEEWELRGFNQFDSWVEYDWYTKKITVYKPVDFTTDVDPAKLKKNQYIDLALENKTVKLRVTEAGTGTVARREGTLTYHVFKDEPMQYAELASTGHDKDAIYSIEKYNEKEFDIYKGQVLSRADQKKVLGRTVQPLINWGTVLTWVIAGSVAGGIFYGGFRPTTETYCTPRTTTSASSGTATDRVCHTRTVYGGGSSGGGK